jgi:DNA-binding transcriptional LysR family regulator
VTALLSGHVDVVVTPRAYRHPELVAAGLPPMPLFVWAAPSNPIAGSPVSCEELSAQAFVVLDAGAVHTAPDGWPAHLLRVEALVVPSISATIEACATAGLLAVLPALAPLQRAGLRRLEGPAIPPMPLVAIRRKDLTEENPPSMACMRLYHSLQAQVG